MSLKVGDEVIIIDSRTRKKHNEGILLKIEIVPRSYNRYIVGVKIWDGTILSETHTYDQLKKK